MFFISKYSEQFKLLLVSEYKEGKLGYNLLAKKHGNPSSTPIKGWVKVYDKYGVNGLMRKKNYKTYSVQFKLDVLRFMKETDSSQTETAINFGITNPATIALWIKAFSEGGAEALDKRKGRPPMSDKPKNRTNKQTKESEMTQKLSRKAQATLSVELKETFRLKDVLQVVGIPESSYHYHVKRMQEKNPDQELEEMIQVIFDDNDVNYGYRVNTLKKNKVFQSMSRKGNYVDHSPIENFFGLLRQELYHGEARCSFEDLKKKIEQYIYYYNKQTYKAKIGWCESS